MLSAGYQLIYEGCIVSEGRLEMVIDDSIGRNLEVRTDQIRFKHSNLLLH